MYILHPTPKSCTTDLSSATSRPSRHHTHIRSVTRISAHTHAPRHIPSHHQWRKTKIEGRTDRSCSNLPGASPNQPVTQHHRCASEKGKFAKAPRVRHWAHMRSLERANESPHHATIADHAGFWFSRSRRRVAGSDSFRAKVFLSDRLKMEPATGCVQKTKRVPRLFLQVRRR